MQSENTSSFLIPRSQRIQFILLFGALTGIAWLSRGFIRPITPRLTLTFFDDGLIWGLVLGLIQWWILRKYFKSKFWILATTVGWGLSMGFYSPLMRMSFGSIAFLILGFLQFLVLRNQVKYSWLWIVVPFIPSTLSDLFTVGFKGYIPLNLMQPVSEIVSAILLGIFPAIILCLFRKT
jgi:hypothetical protein